MFNVAPTVYNSVSLESIWWEASCTRLEHFVSFFKSSCFQMLTCRWMTDQRTLQLFHKLVVGLPHSFNGFAHVHAPLLFAQSPRSHWPSIVGRSDFFVYNMTRGTRGTLANCSILNAPTLKSPSTPLLLLVLFANITRQTPSVFKNSLLP